ncbi:hypothetical protein BC834DRAFT_845328 [Gloeopeniophorella convolvens]|nr:hypothetical protein BC834DRAFT_845328 [Gloeopeniophorella convolvens]
MSSSEVGTVMPPVTKNDGYIDYSHKVKIHSLTDSALLNIFDFYRVWTYPCIGFKQWYHVVPAHVCHRWRELSLTYPKHLELEIVCSPYVNVFDIVEQSPPFPLRIKYWLNNDRDWTSANLEGALYSFGRIDRVSSIEFCAPPEILAKLFSVATKPTPELKSLLLQASSPGMPFPDTFLIEHSMQLRDLYLYNFVSLPRLPPSITLWLDELCRCIYGMPVLEELALDVRGADGIPLIDPPRSPSSLPMLSRFIFTGLSSHLEALVSYVNAPCLDWLHVEFTDWITIIPLPSLTRFLSKSVRLGSKAAHLGLSKEFVHLQTYSTPPTHGTISFKTVRQDPYCLENSITDSLCDAFKPIFASVDTLVIGFHHLSSVADSEEERKAASPAAWRAILASFGSATLLFVDGPFILPVAAALSQPDSAGLLPQLVAIIMQVDGDVLTGAEGSQITHAFKPFVISCLGAGRRLSVNREILKGREWDYRHDEMNYVYG